MSSRQDQLHSYQFTIQRVVAALVMRETDPARSPFRRAAGATLASVLVAAIALGAVAAYGAIVGGGSKSWRDEAVVIVEKESGARYVYRDEKLHPVLNYASALLIVQAASPKTVLVSRKSMEKVPRGVPLGIADAPDSLPAPDRLAGAPWTLCTALGPSAGPQNATARLLVGRPPQDGVPLGESAVLVQAPNRSTFLLWHNRRHPITSSVVLSGLGWSGERPTRVASAFLNSLEVGGSLSTVNIEDIGAASAAMSGATVGEVYVVNTQGGAREYAVAVRDGLSPITQVQVDILLADERIGQAKPIELAQVEYRQAEKAADLRPSGKSAPPASTPRLVAADSGATCALVKGDEGVTELRVKATPPDVSTAARTGSRSGNGTILADYVLVEPGYGALVEAAAAPGAAGGALSVVTALGRRYAVPSTEVLNMLGYDAVTPLRLPAGLVALIPAGEALDPDAARAPAIPG